MSVKAACQAFGKPLEMSAMLVMLQELNLSAESLDKRVGSTYVDTPFVFLVTMNPSKIHGRKHNFW